MAKLTVERTAGGALLLLGLLLGINPLTLLIGIPVILGGLFLLFRRKKR